MGDAGTLDRAGSAMSISVLEFEANPHAASWARSVLRDVQDTGDLKGLFDKVLSAGSSDRFMSIRAEEFVENLPPDDVVEVWAQSVMDSLDRPGSPCRN